MPRYSEQSDHPVPCVDVIVLNDQGEILLTKRAVEPQSGLWAIVGKRMAVQDNNIEATVIRGVKEETGLDVKLENLVDVLSGDFDADPRFFVAQVIFSVKVIGGSLTPTKDASEFKWVPLDTVLEEKLAFNHNRLIEIYKTKKEQGKLLPAERRVWPNNFDKNFVFMQNMYPRFACKAIILNEKNEILLAQRCQAPFVDAWDIPGGHMQVDETPEENLKREIREELGVDSEIGELFQIFSDKGHQPKSAVATAFYFTKVKSQNFLKNIEMQDFKYWPLTALPTDIAYHHESILADIRDWVEKNEKKAV